MHNNEDLFVSLFSMNTVGKGRLVKLVISREVSSGNRGVALLKQFKCEQGLF